MDSETRRLSDLLADMERRLAALETAPRASYTTVRGGSTIWRRDAVDPNRIEITSNGDDVALFCYDDLGLNRLYLGTIAGDPTMRFDNADKSGTVLQIEKDRGMVRPYGVGGWERWSGQTMDAYGRSTTSSGTFALGWVGIVSANTATVYVSTAVALDAGVTRAEIRVRASVAVSDRGGHVPSAAQTVLTRTVSASGTYSDSIALPDGLWTPAASAAGSLVRLDLEARVTLGAGTVYWAPFHPAYTA